MKIRAIIVDDEPHARNKLRLFLAAESDVKVVCECSNGAEAVAALRKFRADVIFLDIQMPEIDGFGVLESLPSRTLPFVVFITAHDTYALKAFEVHALDYLLKPFDRGRFQESLDRVRSAVNRTSIEKQQHRILSLLNDIKTQRQPAERLLVKSGGRVYFVNIAEIDWAEAEGNYLRLHAGNTSHLLRLTLAELERRVAHHNFVRIHRSTLVNLDRVKELRPWFAGEHIAILTNGKRLNVSRSYRKKLSRVFARSS